MKIALFIGTMEGGGAERMTATVANQLAARGHTVDLVLLRARGTYLDQGLVSPAVRVVDLAVDRARHALGPWVEYLRAAKPEAVLSLLTDINVVAILGASLAQVETRLVVSERVYVSEREQSFAPSVRRLRRLTLSLLLRRPAKVVCVSHAAEADLRRYLQLPPEKVTTIYTPIELAQIQQRAAAPLDHPWFAPGAPPVVLGVGRLTQPKNFSFLLRAFARVQRVLPSRLVILGEGAERASLEAEVVSLGLGDRVLLPGFVENPYAYMAKAGVFVLPSMLEGFPNVIMEALACGAAVVSTHSPSGPEELLRGGRDGHLTPLGDEGAMAEAILDSLRTGGPASRGERLRRAEDFSVARAVDAYEATLVGAHRMRPVSGLVDRALIALAG